MKHHRSPRARRAGPLGLALLFLIEGALVLSAIPLDAEAQFRRRRRFRRPATSPAVPKSGGKTGFTELAGEKAFNDCKRFPFRKQVKVTLKPDSKLHDLIAWISGMTCRRFIVHANIRAPAVTLVSPTPISPWEAYRAFLSTLNAMGLTVQPAGRYLKVIPITNAAKSAIQTCTPGQRCPAHGAIVTQLFRLQHVEPDDVSAVLRNLTSGSIITYKPTNLLIITDSGLNINRMAKIIRHLDVESEGDKIWIVRVKYADAGELATKLLEIFPAEGGGRSNATRNVRRRFRRRFRRRAPARSSVSTVSGGSTNSVSKILADERTNVLIIVADERNYLKVRALVRKLDIPVRGGEEKIHIIPLSNADAEDLSTTLAGLTGGAGGRAARGRRTPGRRGAARSRGGRAGSVGLFKGDVQVSPDKPTNSLIVVASVRDYLAMLKVIKKLDRARRQVFVEMTILEVALTKQFELGMSFHGGIPVGSGSSRSLIIGGHNATKSIFLDPAALTGLALGLRGPELADAETLLGVPGISFPTFGAFFQALQTNNDVNIISAPHILTTNNQEAEISVGENVPFQSSISGLPNIGALAGAAGAAGLGGALGGGFPLQSIQRQDVALTLKLTPHINDSDFVRLELDQEINEVKSIDPVVGPTTTKRRIKTTVVVRDQQTVVIGGLITEKVKENVQKVPILGDIPILGYLFKNTTRTKEKTNLLLFLTPYIIRDQDDLRRIFQRKIRQRKEFLERYTAFKDVDLDAVIDYRSKRGLLEEINRVARMSEDETRLKLQAIAEAREVDVDGAVRVDARDLKMLRRLQEETRRLKREARERRNKRKRKGKGKGGKGR